jgi:hypothetical protein
VTSGHDSHIFNFDRAAPIGVNLFSGGDWPVVLCLLEHSQRTENLPLAEPAFELFRRAKRPYCSICSIRLKDLPLAGVFMNRTPTEAPKGGAFDPR